MPHTELNGKADFEKAIETKGKYVLIYASSGPINENADKAADRYADKCDAYKVDVEKMPGAKAHFSAMKLPAVVIFKDGDKIKQIENVNRDNAGEIREVLES